MESDNLLPPGEVSRILGVDPKTLARWALAGKIKHIRTPGGHRRYRESVVRAILATENQ